MKRLALLLLLFAAPAYGQVNALSCSQADVTTAIGTASAGQTVNIPAGSCAWTASGVTLAKAITLNGAGQGVTNISLTANPTMVVTKQVGGPTRIQNITFTGNTASAFPHFIQVLGPWPTGQPVIFYNDTFIANSATIIGAQTPGGVIISHCAFKGQWDNALITMKDTGTTSWTTADTLGTRDTTGFNNFYLEDNTFQGGSNGITDCDDSCRMVFRHNTMGFNGVDSGGPNSHGEDTSPQGMRHFEIYSNSFLFPDQSTPNGTSSLSNINQWIWIRGGSGVIYNNNFDPLYSQPWGDKVEWKFSIRGAEDARPQGACGSVSYPVPHQLGQDYNGSTLVTSPIYVWGNTSNTTPLAPGGVDPHKSLAIEVDSSFGWGNPCAFNWNTFFQWGRDAINTTLGSPVLPSGGGSVEGIGGTAKPGYAAYPYPHPMAAGTSTPIISFSPNPVAFGTVNVASTSAPVTVTVSNIGSASEVYTALGISGGNVGDWAKTGGTCVVPSATLTAGASCTLIYTFTPAAQGARSTTLTMTGTVNSSVSFTGNGQTSISIPSVPANLTATAVGAAVNLSWSGSTGTPDHYVVSRSTVTGGPYTQIATPTAITYSDTGLANGTYFYVVAAHNSAGTSANSTQASATVNTQPNAQEFPVALDFPNSTVGLVTVAQNVTLSNTGTATLSSIVISITGPNSADFAQTSTCSSTLAVNTSCVISVTYTASSTANESASLNIASNDPQGTDSVTLTGEAGAAVTILPISFKFANTRPGKNSATKDFVFLNNSGSIITFVSVVSGSADFSVTANTCTSTLASGLPCTTTVRFNPTSSGSKTTNLTYTWTGGGVAASPQTVALSGTAVGHKISRNL